MAKKIPKTKFPTAATVSYERALVKMVEQMGNEALKLFDKHVAGELMQGDSVIYSKDSASDGLKKMLHSLKSKKSAIFATNKIEGIAKRFLNSVNNANRHNLEQQMRVKGIDLVATEPWLKDFMNDLINDNVSYIKNIEDDAYGRIENIINEHVRKGSPAKTIREEIMKQTGVSKSRAQFLAVDQAGSILGQMTAERHFNLGIERFTWDTSGDERVRDTHKELDGKVFSYDDPPEVNGRIVLPGEDYRCRCVALPVFDDDEEEMNSVEPEEEKPAEFNPEKIMGKTNMKKMVNEKNYTQFVEHLEKVEDIRTKALYEKLASKISYSELSNKYGAFARGSRVQLMQNSFDGKSYSNPLSTVYHENGHALDYLGLQVLTGEEFVLTGKTSKKKILSRTVVVEEKITHASALPEYKLKETIERDLWEYVNGKELPMISDLGRKPRKQAEKEIYENKRYEISTKSRANFSEFDKKMIEKYGRSSRQLAVLSDIYESTPFTTKSYPFGIGHGKSYYKTFGTAESEFFAQISELITTDLESYEIIKEIFPNAVKVWENIVDDILKAGDL